jgi:hypothetical protein
MLNALVHFNLLPSSEMLKMQSSHKGGLYVVGCETGALLAANLRRGLTLGKKRIFFICTNKK